MKQVKMSYTSFPNSKPWVTEEGVTIYVLDTSDSLVYGKVENCSVIIDKNIAGNSDSPDSGISLIFWNTSFGTYEMALHRRMNISSDQVTTVLIKDDFDAIVEHPDFQEEMWVDEVREMEDVPIPGLEYTPNMYTTGAFGRFYGMKEGFLCVFDSDGTIVSMFNIASKYSGYRPDNVNLQLNPSDRSLYISVNEDSIEKFTAYKIFESGDTAQRTIGVPYRDTEDASPHRIRDTFVNKDYFVTWIGNSSQDDGHAHFSRFDIPSFSNEKVMFLDYFSYAPLDTTVFEFALAGILDNGSPVAFAVYSDGSVKVFICNMTTGVPLVITADGIGEEGQTLRSEAGIVITKDHLYFSVVYRNDQGDYESEFTGQYGFDGQLLGPIPVPLLNPRTFIATNDGFCFKGDDEIIVVKGITPIKSMSCGPNEIVAILSTGQVVVGPEYLLE